MKTLRVMYFKDQGGIGFYNPRVTEDDYYHCMWTKAYDEHGVEVMIASGDNFYGKVMPPVLASVYVRLEPGLDLELRT